MRSSSSLKILKWGTLLFNVIVLIVGPTLMAISLQVLFDPQFTHLFFQSGNYYVAHILVAVGALMTVSGILGCIGVLAENSCLLWMFFTGMCLFLVVEITGGVLLYREQDDLQRNIHNSIRFTVERYYGNDVSNTTKFDLLQEAWKCCGTTGYKSWSNSEYFKQHMSRDFIVSANHRVPKSCCVDQSSAECERVSFTEGVGSNSNNVANVIFQEGCDKKLIDAVNVYARYTFVTIAAVALVQIVAMILTAIFVVAIRRTGRDTSRFTSRQGLNSSFASAPMLSNAESAESKRKFNVSSSSMNSLNLEPANMSKTSSLV